MKAPLIFLLACGGAMLLAQGPTTSKPGEGQQPSRPSPEKLLAEMPAPQISVVVREHKLGPDMVRVTAQSSTYPPSLLGEQCQKIGQAVGSPPRGLAVTREQFGPSTSQSFVMASFATDNIIDRASGQLNLGAVVKAFLGAPAPHTVSSIMLTFDGERATAKTLRSFSDKALTLAATASDAPPGIEYRILLHTQNPDEVAIPLDPTEANVRTEKAASPALAPALPPQALALIIVGALALGVLVYFLSLRLPRR